MTNPRLRSSLVQGCSAFAVTQHEAILQLRNDSRAELSKQAIKAHLTRRNPKAKANRPCIFYVK